MTTTLVQHDRERGAGVVSMSFGLVIFLILLTFAINLLYNLYATSVISSLALDAARDAAEYGGSASQAESAFNSQVTEEANFTITDTTTHVVVTIDWERRSLFPRVPTPDDAPAFGKISRTFTVRKELKQQP